ncbi:MULTISPECIES: pentapeptide repeat-containing protein [unclassified Thioalkalivibrio]|uniref:pentapeptide repeat-containing protein n=1 Tax=unclassified Thioalkalivibrio TaxID=2621013 RepID=UPI00036E7817|nr:MULTISPECIES: pentapeptide repeat-containing protein [unclassified Thioalkalivibrio]
MTTQPSDPSETTREATDPPPSSSEAVRHERWFLRRPDGVCGPYPARQIGRFLILGRLTEQDEISQDREFWVRIAERPHLIPEEVRLANTPGGKERLERARLREDERLRERRSHASDSFYRDQRKGDRRCPENLETLNHRQLWAALLDRTPFPWRQWVQGPRPWILSGVALFLATGLLVWFAQQQEITPAPDCDAPPGPSVNWNYCNKSGAALRGADLAGASLYDTRLSAARLERAQLADADLRYANLDRARLDGADLSRAQLTGADLRSARLRSTRLEDADLRHADLSGADLTDARLEGARLDRAIWIDGRICAAGSVGHCESSATD